MEGLIFGIYAIRYSANIQPTNTIQPCVWPCHEWKGNYRSIVLVTKLPELY